MRIALLAEPGEGHLGPALQRGFAAEGHDAQLVPAAALVGDGRLMPRARKLHLDAVPSRVLTGRAARAAAGADVVLVLRGRFLRRADVEALRRRTGAPIVLYHPDNPLFGRLREPPVLRSLPAYDLVVVWCTPLAAALADVGVRRRAVVPFGYDSAEFARAGSSDIPRFDVAFVGSASPHRLRWIAELAGLELALTGPRWRREARGTPLAAAVLPGARWGAGAAAVYRSARVGINVLDPQNLIGHNMRTWELPATGRPAVMTRTPDHERLFANGGAVLVEKPEELRSAVQRLLADPEERERIGRLGYDAVRAGTYERRARELVSAFAPLLPST